MFRMTVLTCLWKRPEVASIMLDNLAKVRSEIEAQIALSIVAVGSEGEDSKRLAEEREAVYVEYENQPLGAKWNAGLRACMGTVPDAVLILGSDNIVNDRLILAWAREIRQGLDYVGFLDGYMLDAYTNRLIHWMGYRGARAGEPLGSGRCYSKQLLTKLKWVLWDSSKRRALDSTVTKRLATIRGLRQQAWLMSVHGIRHLGIKTDANLSPFEAILKNPESAIQGEDPQSLVTWYGEIGQRILDLKPSVPQGPPVELPPRKTVAGENARLEAELRDSVVCPRCYALTATNRVIVNTKLRPGEKFICAVCELAVQEKKDRERQARIPSARDFLPSVSSSLEETPEGGGGPSIVSGGDTPFGIVDGREPPEEFEP